MSDILPLKLGRLPAKIDRRNLYLSTYLNLRVLPNAPDSLDWAGGITVWQMLGNDRFGDCTFASAGHIETVWLNQNHRGVESATEGAIVSEYLTFNQGADSGCAMLDVLKLWRDTGIAGHKIDAYMMLNPLNIDFVKEAIYLFGAVYAGVELPLTAQGQDIWDIDDRDPGRATAGSWGGHAIPIVAYDKDGGWCVTWGNRKRFTWAWWRRYAATAVGGEAYVCLSKDWADLNTIAPNSFKYDQLTADLSAL